MRIQEIATDKLQDELERNKKKCDTDGMDLEEKWNWLMKCALNLAGDKYLTRRETTTGSKKDGPDKMDVNTVGMNGK